MRISAVVDQTSITVCTQLPSKAQRLPAKTLELESHPWTPARIRTGAAVPWLRHRRAAIGCWTPRQDALIQEPQPRGAAADAVIGPCGGGLRCLAPSSSLGPLALHLQSIHPCLLDFFSLPSCLAEQKRRSQDDIHAGTVAVCTLQTQTLGQGSCQGAARA